MTTCTVAHKSVLFFCRTPLKMWWLLFGWSSSRCCLASLERQSDWMHWTAKLLVSRTHEIKLKQKKTHKNCLILDQAVRHCCLFFVFSCCWVSCLINCTSCFWVSCRIHCTSTFSNHCWLLSGLGMGALGIGLTVRIVVAYLAVMRTNLNWKERLFIPLAWLPKATVQVKI